ncbi:MAG: ABC transporter substrate-binding protein [Oscillospiraceae bacterium]|nr:ABC transporter substrate-binding protein [Oscillospiraceae bacterium]
MRKIIAVLLVAIMLVPAFALSEGTIKIGIFEPITGSYAGGGAMEVEGYELAKEHYPEVLGLPIEFIVADSKSDKVEASNAAASLVSQGVVAVLGSYSSGLCLSGADVFAAAGIPTITPTGTNPTVTESGWYARICFIDPQQGPALAGFAIGQGYKKVGVIQEIESEYATGLVKFFKEKIDATEGIEISSTGNFFNADQDFTTLLTEAISKEPDAIFASVGAPATAGLIVKQARELGYDGPIFGGDTLDGPELYQIAGEAAAGVVFSTFCDADQPLNDITARMVSDYRAKYNKKPAAPTMMSYDAYLTLLDAITRAGTATDSTAIRDAIFATSGFVGAAGEITLNETHDAVRPVVFVRKLADGSETFLASVDPE